MTREQREEFDERAGILEFEAGLPRHEAEIEAVAQIAEQRAREAVARRAEAPAA